MHMLKNNPCTEPVDNQVDNLERRIDFFFVKDHIIIRAVVPVRHGNGGPFAPLGMQQREASLELSARIGALKFLGHAFAFFHSNKISNEL